MENSALYWTGIQALFCLLWFTFIVRYKLSGQTITKIAYILCGIAILLSALKKDTLAGKTIEFVL
jgi:hypothetical protein